MAGLTNITSGAVDITNLEKYRAILSTLTEEQKALALSTSGLNAAQANMVLTYSEGAYAETALSEAEANRIITQAGLTASIQALSAEELASLATKTGLTQIQLKQALEEAGAIVTKEGDVVVTEALNVAELEQSLISAGCAKANAAETASLIAETSAKSAATAATTKFAGASNLLLGAFSKLSAVIVAHPIVATLAAITAGVALFVSKQKKHKEEIRKIAEEVTGTYESTIDRLTTNKGDFDDISEEYATLSKGVNALGDNVSLTTDEYDRYHEVANKLAEITPSLVKAWDDQGNAILNVKGNIEQLTEAYDKEIIAANNAIIANGSVLMEESAAKLEDKDVYSAGDFSYQERIDKLKTLSDKKTAITKQDLEAFKSVYVDSNGQEQVSYQDLFNLLQEANIDTTDIDWFNPDDFVKKWNNLTNEEKSRIDNYITKTGAALSEGLQNRKNIFKADLQNKLLSDTDYTNIGKNLQDVLYNMTDTIDNSVFEKLNTEDQIYEYVDKILTAFNSLSDEDQESIEEYVNLTTLWNNDEIPYSEYVEKMTAFSNLLTTLFDGDEETQKSFKILFDIPEEGELDKTRKVFTNRLGEQILSGKSIEDTKLDTDKLKDNINEQLEELEKGGGVNLKLRPEIDTQLLKDAGWKDIEDGIATVYSSTFSNEEGSKYINFTPIIIDPETGEYKGVLSPDELTKYAEGVIAGTRTDDLNLQIGTEFDTLEEAENAAEKVHTLHERLSNLNNTSYTGSMAGMPSDVENHLKTQGTEVADVWYDSLTKSEREFVDNLSDEDLAEAVKFESTEQFNEWLDKLQSVADSKKIEVRTNAGAAENLDSMKDAFDDLSTAYMSSVKNEDSEGNATNNVASASDIQGVNDAFGGVTEITSDTALEDINALSNALEAYSTTLIENKGDAEAAQAAADKLATAYVDQSDVLDDLTEENKEYYKEQLKANGITNADEVIESRLSKQYQKTREALEKLSKSVAKNRKYLDAGVDAGEDYENAIKDISSDVMDLITIYDDAGEVDKKLTPDFSETEMTNFIKDNLEDIEAATEGDIDALVRLKMEVARLNAAKAYVNIDLPSDVVEAQLDNLMDKVAQVDAMNIEVGASVDDTAFIASLQNMIESGQTTADAVAASFESMGYEAKWTPNKYTATIAKTILSNGTGNATADIQTAKGIAALEKQSVEMDIPSLTITRKNNSTGAKVSGYNGGSSSNNSGGSGDGGSDSGSDSEETFDWVEVAIDRLESHLDKLNETIDNTYDNWESRNKAITDSIAETNKEIELQEAAAETYWNKAESVGLSEEYKKKVREGKLEIETIKNDDDLVDQINDYKTYYEKYLAAKDQTKTLTLTIQGYWEKMFNNVKTQYEQLLDNIAKKTEIIDERISRMEEHGYFVNESYYIKQRDLELQNNAKLVKERESLIKRLNDAVETGKIKKGSEAWNSMYQDIESVNKQIEESYTNVVKLNNTMLELKWSKLDWIEERLADIGNEAEHLKGILANKDLFEYDVHIKDDNKKYSTGKFSDAGMATAALTMAEYDASLQGIERYKARIKDLQEEIKSNPDNTKLIEELETVTKGLREMENSAETAEQAIKDLFKNAIDKNIETLEALINKYTETLQSAKDLYDYQKNITDQTKNIVSLEKQLAAYKNDTSDESRKKRVELQQQLDQARTGLKETQWDKYISETSAMLSDMSSDYQEFLNSKLDDIKGVIEAVVAEINDNKTKVADGINAITEKYGVDTTNFKDWQDKTFNKQKEIVDVEGKNNTSIGTIITALNKIVTKVTNSNENKNGTTSIVETGSVDINVAKDGTVAIKGTKYQFKDAVGELDNGKGKDGKGSSGSFGSASDYEKEKDTGSGKNGKGSSGVSESKEPETTKTTKTTTDTKAVYKPKSEWYNGAYYNAKGKKDTSIGNLKYKTDKKGSWYEYYKTGSKTPIYYKNTDVIIDGKRYFFDGKGYVIKKKTQKVHDVVKGYATGTNKVPNDQLAWTQENNSELIYRTTDGAILTPLNKGDMVFNHDMSQRLWDIAKGTIPTGSNGAALVKTTANFGDSTVNASVSITLPNVKNYDEFKKELQNDNNFEKFVQEITVGQLNGNNTLNKRKY